VHSAATSNKSESNQSRPEFFLRNLRACRTNARSCNKHVSTFFPGAICREYLLQKANEWQQKCKTYLLLGYARVSKIDFQDIAAQVEELKKAGCKKIFEENASGGRWDPPKLHQALEHLREGDVLVVWKLDRLSRSLKDLLNILEKVAASEAGFQRLTESIDTAAGRMLMQILGSFAEFERAMVRERTKAGLLHARGRPNSTGCLDIYLKATSRGRFSKTPGSARLSNKSLLFYLLFLQVRRITYL
jgi:hypothetical protein